MDRVEKEFLEACRARLASIQADHRELAWRWEKYTHDRKCLDCGAVGSAYSCGRCNACGSWSSRFELVANANAGCLPLPEGLASACVAGDYGGWGSVGAANAREIEEIESVEKWFVYAHTYEGGEYAFDPSNASAVAELASIWESFDGYPVISDDRLSEVESELMDEHLDSWMVFDLVRETIGDLDRKISDELTEDQIAKIERAIEALENDELDEAAREICYAHLGYYSVDDMGLHDDAHKVLGAIALGFERSDWYGFEIGWGDWKKAVEAYEVTF